MIPVFQDFDDLTFPRLDYSRIPLFEELMILGFEDSRILDGCGAANPVKLT